MKQVYIILTKKCNLNCIFCIRDYSQNINYSVDLKNIQDILVEIKENFPNTNIILSGGEPTLHKEFDLILERTCEIFNNVTINTNGTTDFFQTDFFVNFIKRFSIKIQFSLDGESTLHNELRGKNNYEKTLKNIIFCSSFSNIKIQVASTISDKRFLKDFNKVYDDISNISNLKWDIKRVSYSGNASIEDYQYLNNDIWNSIVDEIKLIDFKNIINIYKTFDFNFLDTLDNKVINSFSKQIVKNCGSGLEKIYIYPNMDVLSCTCYESYPSGNLLENNLNEILTSKRHLIVQNQIIDNSVCNNCKYKILCNGGCLGSGFFKYNKHNVADIKCPKIYEFFKSIDKTDEKIDQIWTNESDKRWDTYQKNKAVRMENI